MPAPLGIVASSQGGKFQRWQTARDIARAGGAQASVVCYGDSITRGEKASNNDTSTDADKTTWANSGWVGQLRTTLQASIGNGGYGYVHTYPDESEVVTATTGTVAVLSVASPMSIGLSMSASSTATIALRQCTEFDICYAGAATTDASFTLTIDGGAPQTVANPGTTDAHKQTFSGLADTPHTVIVTAGATKAVFVQGFLTRRSNTGVVVHRMGRSGGTTTHGAGAGTAAFNACLRQGAFTLPDPDLVIIALMTNDFANQVGNAMTPTIYGQNLTTMVDYITGTQLASCLLVVGPFVASDWQATHGFTYSDLEFRNAARAVADANLNCGYLDLGDTWGTHENADTVLHYFQDTVHPTLSGHVSYASLVAAAIA